MTRPKTKLLDGYRLLIVEDEYLLAIDLCRTLEEWGAEVLGPVGSLSDAMTLIQSETRIDCAVLDINLGGERSYPLADVLLGRGVEIIFTTGYDISAIPEKYAGIRRYEKPFDTVALARVLASRSTLDKLRPGGARTTGA
jgi:DNA-binding response OmpR family regulator